MSSKSPDTPEQPLSVQPEMRQNSQLAGGQRDARKERLGSPHSEQALIEAREELGAGKAEASVKVWGKYSRWVLYIRYLSSFSTFPG